MMDTGTQTIIVTDHFSNPNLETIEYIIFAYGMTTDLSGTDQKLIDDFI
jgi:hypothetical protein